MQANGRTEMAEMQKTYNNEMQTDVKLNFQFKKKINPRDKQTMILHQIISYHFKKEL